MTHLAALVRIATFYETSDVRKNWYFSCLGKIPNSKFFSMYQFRQLFLEEGKAYIPLKNYVLSNQTQLLFPHIVSVETILFWI